MARVELWRETLIHWRLPQQWIKNQFSARSLHLSTMRAILGYFAGDFQAWIIWKVMFEVLRWWTRCKVIEIFFFYVVEYLVLGIYTVIFIVGSCLTDGRFNESTDLCGWCFTHRALYTLSHGFLTSDTVKYGGKHFLYEFIQLANSPVMIHSSLFLCSHNKLIYQAANKTKEQLLCPCWHNGIAAACPFVLTFQF